MLQTWSSTLSQNGRAVPWEGPGFGGTCPLKASNTRSIHNVLSMIAFLDMRQQTFNLFTPARPMSPEWVDIREHDFFFFFFCQNVKYYESWEITKSSESGQKKKISFLIQNNGIACEQFSRKRMERWSWGLIVFLSVERIIKNSQAG